MNRMTTSHENLFYLVTHGHVSWKSRLYIKIFSILMLLKVVAFAPSVIAKMVWVWNWFEMEAPFHLKTQQTFHYYYYYFFRNTELTWHYHQTENKDNKVLLRFKIKIYIKTENSTLSQVFGPSFSDCVRILNKYKRIKKLLLFNWYSSYFSLWELIRRGINKWWKMLT